MKKIVFLTGTRADFGKIKALIKVVQDHENLEQHVFVTGMHMQKKYGYTLLEVQRSGFDNISTFENHTSEETMDLTLAKTIRGFSEFVSDVKPDLIIVHGDRVEALAGAIVGALNNILVAHIEGGEVSGTIDELIRHSVSKLSHIHFVSNEEAMRRLVQMGEAKESIHVIGSPDLDLMFSPDLPPLQEAKEHYEIPFETYSVCMFHPVTTESDQMEVYAKSLVNALLNVNENFIVIFPNNDLGNKHILDAYEELKGKENFKIFPSIRFEYFLVLLKNANSLIGNSSAGVREAPYYNVPTVNIGTRQNNRIKNHKSILNSTYEVSSILDKIQEALEFDFKEEDNFSQFGHGNSADLFKQLILSNEFWNINNQKHFIDINI